MCVWPILKCILHTYSLSLLIIFTRHSTCAHVVLLCVYSLFSCCMLLVTNKHTEVWRSVISFGLLYGLTNNKLMLVWLVLQKCLPTSGKIRPAGGRRVQEIVWRVARSWFREGQHRTEKNSPWNMSKTSVAFWKPYSFCCQGSTRALWKVLQIPLSIFHCFSNYADVTLRTSYSLTTRYKIMRKFALKRHKANWERGCRLTPTEEPGDSYYSNPHANTELAERHYSPTREAFLHSRN